MTESSIYKTALNKAMAQCSRREYCCDDIRNKLISWGVSGNDSERIIANLIKENFINEKRFATAFVKDKFNYNKWGKIKIAAHLRHKNIPGEIVKEALDLIDYDAYIKALKDIISSHRRSVKSKNQYDLKAKLLRYGLSKGFETSLLYEVLNESED